MKNCQNCGKPIERDNAHGDYCSIKCRDSYLKKPKGSKPLEANEVLDDSTKSYNYHLSGDLNIELIEKAIETKTVIVLTPRRSHTIKGIPVRFDSNIYRIYIDTGRDIESVLLKEIGHFSFPKTLFQIESSDKIAENVKDLAEAMLKK